MATNFLPKTFSGGGYDVTVNADRSIKVRPGDWLSKYSMAIYGNFDHIKKFKEKIGTQYRDVPNPDLIKVGDTLYHPDPLPKEPRQPSIVIPVPGMPPEAEPPIQTKYVSYFLQWVKGRFIDSGWRVTSTGGVDLSLLFMTGQYTTIGLLNKNNVGSETRWVHALSTGFAFGFPESLAGASFSTTQMPDVGWILRAPVHRQLTIDDFRFGVIVVEVGSNHILGVGGASLALLFFGIGVPITYAIGHLNSYFRTGDPSLLNVFLNKCLPGGVMILYGTTIGLPSIGIAARIGVMYDRGYWGV
jgi:hypothetical protein